MARRIRNLVDLVAAPAPGANADIPTATVTVGGQGRAVTRIEVEATLVVTTVFKIIKRRGLLAPQTLRLNGGAPLGAGAAAAFSVRATPGDVLAFQVETDGAIAALVVDEVLEGGDA